MTQPARARERIVVPSVRLTEATQVLAQTLAAIRDELELSEEFPPEVEAEARGHSRVGRAAAG